MTLVVVADGRRRGLPRPPGSCTPSARHHPARIVAHPSPSPTAPASGVDARVTHLRRRGRRGHPVTFEEIALDGPGRRLRPPRLHHRALHPLRSARRALVPGDAAGGVRPPAARGRHRAGRQQGDRRAVDGAAPAWSLARRRWSSTCRGTGCGPGGSCSPACSTGRPTGPSSVGITSVEVDGKPGPRRLLAGWLASAPGPPGRPGAPDRRPPRRSIRLHAALDGPPRTFEVVRERGRACGPGRGARRRRPEPPRGARPCPTTRWPGRSAGP